MSSATEFLEKILDLVHEDYPEVGAGEHVWFVKWDDEDGYLHINISVPIEED